MRSLSKALFFAMILSGLVIGCSTASAASASIVYVTQSGAGSANGTSLSNAFPISVLSNTSNCGSGSTQIGPGTTVHISVTTSGNGIATFPAGANMFSLPSACNGSSGNPVLLQFQAGDVWQAPYFASGGAHGAIGISGDSYIIVDGGGTAANFGSDGATIQNTLNGTAGGSCLGGACTYQNTSTAIFATRCQNCEIRNWNIVDMYVHTKCEAVSGCDVSVDQTGVNAVQFSGANLHVHHVTTHDIGWAFFSTQQSGDSNLEFDHLNIYRMDHGVVPGTGTSNINSFAIHDSHFHDMDNWDTGTQDAYHHDGIHSFTASSGLIANIYVYNNLFDGNEGNCCVTSQVFLEAGYTTAYVWNNIIIGTNDVGYGQLGIYVGTGSQVYNNFIQGTNLGNNGECIGWYATNVTIENNIIEGCDQLLHALNGGTLTAADYNMYGNSTGGNSHWQVGGTSVNTLAAWQVACGCDSHAKATSPLSSAWTNITSAGVPQTGFAGIKAGGNLENLATGALSSLASDTSDGGARTPTARPSSGAWDMGAYMYVGSPAPPTNLTAVPQ